MPALPPQLPPRLPPRPKLHGSTKDWALIMGRLEDDASHASTVQFLLDHQRGTAAAFPSTGSRFHTIKKILPNTTREVELMALEALAPLISRRNIWNVKATATRKDQSSVIELVVEFTDVKGKQNPITKYLTVGRK